MSAFNARQGLSVGTTPTGVIDATGNGTFGTLSGSTITATTQFSGPGTGLTGTAASLTAGAVSSITSSQVTGALGFTPYNATNPSGYISANQTITLTGDVTGSGATAITTTLAAATVTGKALTGYVVGSNAAVTATDTILSAFGKLQAQVTAAPGTVTTLSVASANGFTGSVASASTSPVITMATSITGMLKGNGTALVAATAADYVAPGTAPTLTGTNFTGIPESAVTNLTTDLAGKAATGQTFFLGTTSIAINRASGAIALTGITSIDGNAATATTLQTARAINGVPFNGSADITVYDSTKQAQLNGTGFVKVSGTTVSYDNSTYLTGTKVDSFNTRTGAVTLTFSDVTTALNYTPYQQNTALSATTGTFSSNISTGGRLFSTGQTSPNLHLDPTSGANSVYLNYYQGTGGTKFCNGANGVVASIDGSGNGTFNSISINPVTLDLSGLDQATWYPVTIAIPTRRRTRMRIMVALDSGTVPNWSTHSQGFSVLCDWTSNGYGWGTVPITRTIHTYTYSFSNVSPVGGITQMGNTSLEVVYLRGGGKYLFEADYPVTPVIQTTSYTVNSQTVSPSTSLINDVFSSATAPVAFGSGTFSSALSATQFNGSGAGLTGTAPSLTAGACSGNAATATSLSGFGNPTTASTGNTIVYRDPNGYITNSYFYTSSGGAERNTSGMGYFAGFNSSDYYIRSYTPAAVAAAISGQTMNINGSSTSCSGTASATAMSSGRTDTASYPVVWGTTGSSSQLYSCTAVNIQSSTGTLFATVLNASSSVYAGTVYSTGDVIAYYSSDRKLKKNIQPIENPLQKIMALNGVEFDWNDLYLQNHKNAPTGLINEHEIGLIAQEVEQILPALVTTREDGFLAIKYDKIVPVLIEAVKEQQKQIEAQQAQINSLIELLNNK